MLQTYQFQKQVKEFGVEELRPINFISNSAYFHTIYDGTFNYKKKFIPFTKVEIARFTPKIKSGVVSLNSTVKPSVTIYSLAKDSNEEVPTHKYFGQDNTVIKTKKGEEIIFKQVGNEFKPFIKNDNGIFIQY